MVDAKNDCDVVFDFCSQHNGEYWYKCNTCGSEDWVPYYDKFERNEPLKDCPGVYDNETTNRLTLGTL